MSPWLLHICEFYFQRKVIFVFENYAISTWLLCMCSLLDIIFQYTLLYSMVCLWFHIQRKLILFFEQCAKSFGYCAYFVLKTSHCTLLISMSSLWMSFLGKEKFVVEHYTMSIYLLCMFTSVEVSIEAR
jgi:hypothetical protein